MNDINYPRDAARVERNGNPGSVAANVLRGLGAAATVFGAVIFMLQGFEHIALAWRPWFYLAFIALLGVGGAVSLYALRDARGARLFFALAAALVPVQFTQLGGMLYTLWHQAPGPVPGIFQSGMVTPGQTVIMAAVSAVVLTAASWAGFAIMVRPHARLLVATYLAAGALLLAPARASLTGMAVLAALAAVFLWLELRRFRTASAFATWEGWAVRCMFLMPLGIAAVRAAFYLPDLTMCAMLFTVAGVLLTVIIRDDFRPWIAEGLRAIASTCLVIAWPLLALEIFSLTYDYLWFAVIYPAGLVLLAVAHFAPRSGGYYRCLGMALLAFGAYALVFAASDLPAWLVVLATGVGLCFGGSYYRERALLISGALLSVVGLIGIVALSLRAVAVDTWLVLAVAGILLVLLSSVAERFRLPIGQVRRLVGGRGHR